MEDIANQVFNIEHILDKILDYVIHKGSEEISTADACSARLVNKDWLRSTSRCLDKSKKPLFCLRLNGDTSLNASEYVQGYGKLLDKFITTVTGPPLLGEQVLPFGIQADCDFFRQENYESLLQCFTRCGNSLVNLTMFLPKDGGTMTFKFPNLLLPKLQSCRVGFWDEPSTELAAGERILGEINSIYLLQQIFSGCKELHTFDVESDPDNESVPYSLERLVLPATISTLGLLCFDLKNSHLKLLTKNDLPNLRELYLNNIGDSIEDGLIYKVLLNFQDTLIKFCSGMGYYCPPREVTYFQFPVMKELEVFESCSMGLELDVDQRMLGNKLPKLRKLCLERQTIDMFRKWTESSNYTSVMELIVSLVDENFDEIDEFEEFHVSFRLEMMQVVSTTFRNHRILEITVCGTELSGLKHAFDNLKQLQVLRVIARRTESIVTSDCWDALLIGIPDVVATSLGTTGFWSQVTDFKEEVLSSIKALTELQELVLETRGQPRDNEWEETDSLISDAVFQFAFTKMPRLMKIALIGRFMASLKAEQEWKEKGCEISCKTEDIRYKFRGIIE